MTRHPTTHRVVVPSDALARPVWAALFVAHAAWLLRLVVIDASWSRQALLLLATLFLAWMTWNHRAGWIRRDRRSIVVCSVIVAMLHVNVVRRAIDIPADALPWTVPTLAGAAVCFLLHRIRRGHRHDRYTSTAIRTRSASTCPWDRVPDRIVSLAHQCAAALVTAPRAPPF